MPRLFQCSQRLRHCIRTKLCLLMLAGLSSFAALAAPTDLPVPDLAELPGNDCDKPVLLPARAQMEKELQAYLRLSEQTLAMRATAIRLYHELQAKQQQKLPLSGEDLRIIQQGAADLLAQRAELLDIALAHECWTKVAPESGEAGDIRRAGVLMSLSAALTLYDNYLSAISLYRDDPKLRQKLNRGDKGFNIPANELMRVDRMFSSPENRRRIRQAIYWYRQHTRVERPPFEGYDYLLQSIEQSPFYHMAQQRQNPVAMLGNAFKMAGTFTIDAIAGLKTEGTHFSSLLFGNTVGLVETRRGKLDKRPEVLTRIGGKIQAGDILLEKTPFRLTDSFIPGHWGHAALWIGTEAELKELDLWDHPLVSARHAEIRAGRSVIEALRSGVEMNSLPRFLNIDDLAILRQPGLSPDKRREMLLQALRQVGKAYDFNFDAESTDRIFCSKLVYMTHADITWPTSRIMGRFTVSPDDIAKRAVIDPVLELVLLYHDGKEIGEEREKTMAGLLALE
ncbi:MAG: hypothetical protein LBB51_00810 [Zoogloeaceae bacterium]|nr:hypothetical protein [Zoogloeaceae bacterium]